MGERKVLNKYYPPDFDPAKIPRRRQPKNQQIKVRMMLPMSIRCATCGTYIYKGTKFNSRKEDAAGETYLGIQIFRFYFKCTKCSAEITFKTDPQNSDYTVESGASRNFEPWREEEEASEREKRKREKEEMGDAMKTLENKALDSKQDMDILASLEEMRTMKSRQATITVDQMLEILKRSALENEKKDVEELDEMDEEYIRSIYSQKAKEYIRRIDDEDDSDDELPQSLTSPERNRNPESSTSTSSQKPTDVLSKASVSQKSDSGGSTASLRLMPKFVVKPKASEPPIAKKLRHDDDANLRKGDDKGPSASSCLASLQNYDSSESE